MQRAAESTPDRQSPRKVERNSRRRKDRRVPTREIRAAQKSDNDSLERRGSVRINHSLGAGKKPCIRTTIPMAEVPLTSVMRERNDFLTCGKKQIRLLSPSRCASTKVGGREKKQRVSLEPRNGVRDREKEIYSFQLNNYFAGSHIDVSSKPDSNPLTWFLGNGRVMKNKGMKEGKDKRSKEAEKRQRERLRTFVIGRRYHPSKGPLISRKKRDEEKRKTGRETRNFQKYWVMTEKGQVKL